MSIYAEYKHGQLDDNEFWQACRQEELEARMDEMEIDREDDPEEEDDD